MKFKQSINQSAGEDSQVRTACLHCRQAPSLLVSSTLAVHQLTATATWSVVSSGVRAGLALASETRPKLQTLVHDILPSTTAVFSYAIGSRKLSANEQFLVGAQTVVNLLQTTQIISDVCFTADHVA